MERLPIRGVLFEAFQTSRLGIPKSNRALVLPRSWAYPALAVLSRLLPKVLLVKNGATRVAFVLKVLVGQPTKPGGKND